MAGLIAAARAAGVGTRLLRPAVAGLRTAEGGAPRGAAAAAGPRVWTLGLVGLGNWGTALGHQWGEAGHAVTGYTIEQEVFDSMRKDGENRKYLPGAKTKMGVTMDLAEVAQKCDLIVLGAPSHAILSVVDSLMPHLESRHVLVDIAKGLAPAPPGGEAEGAMETLSTSIERKLEAAGKHIPVAVLTGPTIAPEVARGVTSTALVACEEHSVAVDLARDLSTPSLHLQPADDPRGAELWGAFKNPIALACGMADGLHPEGGDNLKAALVMAGFNEGMRLLGAMGAKTETAFGAAGLGDMYVTSTSQNSRNRTLGQKLGTGLSLEAALGEMHMVAEGVRATRMFRSEAQALGVEHPFLEAMAGVLDGEVGPEEAARRMVNAC